MNRNRAGPWQQGENDQNQRNNFIAHHWRGELSLPVSYWIIGFFGNIGAMVVVATIVAASQASPYNPFLIFAVQVGIWGSIGVILTWQVVGVWRSANAYIKAGRPVIWAGLAKLMVVLGLLSSAGTFIEEGYEPMAHMARIAFLDDPDIDPYYISVLRGGTEVEVYGGFKFGLARDFEKVLEQNRQIRVVHLTSRGGRMGEAERLYEIIRQRSLATYVPIRCLSACTLAFVGGHERWLGQFGRLGFHSPGGPTVAPSEMASTRREWVERYVQAGVSRAFVARALAVPHDSMTYPDYDILFASRVVTNRADPYRFAISGYGPRHRLSVERLSDNFSRAVPFMDAIQRHDPLLFDGLISNLERSYRLGLSEGEIADALGAMVLRAVAERRGRADDATIYDLTKLTVQIMTELAEKDPGLCYRMSLGTHSRMHYAATLSRELQAREQELVGRVFASRGAPSAPSREVVDALTEGVIERAFDRMTYSQIAVLDIMGGDLDPEAELDACRAITVIMDEVTRLRPLEAGIVMREVFLLGE